MCAKVPKVHEAAAGLVVTAVGPGGLAAEHNVHVGDIVIDMSDAECTLLTGSPPPAAAPAPVNSARGGPQAGATDPMPIDIGADASCPDWMRCSEFPPDAAGVGATGCLARALGPDGDWEQVGDKYMIPCRDRTSEHRGVCDLATVRDSPRGTRARRGAEEAF